MRPGRNWLKAGNPITASNKTISAASRPAMRQAMAAAPAIVGRSHSIGHTVRISRSAIAGFGEQAEQRERAGKPGIDQPRPVRLVTAGDAPLREVVPALPGQPVAQLRKPHRIVGVREHQRRGGPMLRQKLDDDEQPREPKQECEVRLAHGCGHDGLFPPTALSFA